MQPCQVPSCKYSKGKCPSPCKIKSDGKYYIFCVLHHGKAIERNRVKAEREEREVQEILQQLQDSIKPSKTVIHHPLHQVEETDVVLEEPELQQPFFEIQQHLDQDEADFVLYCLS